MTNQLNLFGDCVSDEENKWENEWKNMPEYNNVERSEPEIIVIFKFRNIDDYNRFHSIIKDALFDGEKPFDGMQRENRKTTWYPHFDKPSNYLYVNKEDNES